MRSLLFVPGDSPTKIDKALGGEADALILDLEDSVAPAAKTDARALVERVLAAPRTRPLWVRCNPLGSGEHDADVAMILRARADALVLPKAEGAGSIRSLPHGVAVVPIATETPRALFALGSYIDVADRLAGLTWGAEDLPAATGAATAREEDGRYTPPYETVRALALFAAHAAGVPAIETVYPAFRDTGGLERYCARGRRDGFTAMMAIHPAQVPVINRAFTPSAEEVAHAQAVVAAFADHPGAGTLAVAGRMVDRPHLEQARRLLARSATR